jgi:maltose alpha-D-glucosyltransferase/alpha-amylase
MTLADRERVRAWARLWQTWSSWAFLKGYTVTAGDALFMPKTPDEMRVLLNAFQMEKAVYELGYELNNRPDWLRVPLAGIEQLLGIEVPERDDVPQSRE